MKDQNTIIIFTYNRRNYLRICLDSLRVSGFFGKWKIVVSIDGGSDGPEQIDGVEWIHYTSHVGNLWHVVRSLHSVRSNRLMFIDDDMVVSKNAFQYINTEKFDTLFLCLGGGYGSGGVPGTDENSFCPVGNITSSTKIGEVLEYAYNMNWVGLKRPVFENTVLDSDYPGYDAIFFRYMLDSGKLTRYSPVPLVCHIGVSGTDNHDHDKIESSIFTEYRDQWLHNAMKVFKTQPHKAFVPKEFVYE